MSAYCGLCGFQLRDSYQDGDHCVECSERELILNRLEKYYTVSEAENWLNAPHPQIPDGKSANDLLKAGRFAEVNQIIDRLDAESFI